MRSPSALVAACHEASCRPPTSGGTGGSSPLSGRRMLLQHVASRENAASIRQQGFRTDTPAWVKSFGNGVYFAYAGDEKSRKFYQRQGSGRTPQTSEVMRATGVLDNPAEFRIKTHSDFRNQAADLLGGRAAVKAKAQRMYDDYQEQARQIFKEELGDEFGKLNYVREGNFMEDAFFWDITPERYDKAIARFKTETGLDSLYDLGHYKNIAQNDDVWAKKPQASDVHSQESQVLGNMLRDEGYDGLIIRTNNWAGVGGDQVVVFDPKKVSLVAAAALLKDFACHTAECRPPTAGGTGGSSPKAAHGVPFKTANGWSITAADGTVLKATFSKTNPPYDPDPKSDIDNSIWDSVAKDALRGLMHSYDLAPIDKVPSIVLGDYTTHPGMIRQYQDMIDQLAKKRFTYRDATGKAVTAEEMAGFTSGFMYPRGAPGNALPPGTIGIMASKRQYDNAFTGAKSTTSMPESLAVPEMEYVAAHEYGHHRYWNGPDGIPRHRATTMYQIYRRDAAMSEYGQTNEREAHAEAFAAWVTNEAMGLPQRQVTKDYQDEFGWGEEGAPRGRGLSFELDEDASDVVAVYDTEYGPIYVHKNGSVRFYPVDSENALQADSQVRESDAHRNVPEADSNRIYLV